MSHRFAPPLAVLLLLAPGAAASDEPISRDLAWARDQMDRGNWTAAARALNRVLESNEGSGEVLARLHEIEASLKRCLYRSEARDPTAEELFGKTATKFVPRTRLLMLDHPGGAMGRGWVTDGKYRVLQHRFEKEVSVEFEASITDNESGSGVPVFINFDPEALTGYMVIPGYLREHERSDMVYELDSKIIRMDGENLEASLAQKPAVKQYPGYGLQRINVRKKGSRITLAVDGRTRLSANDAKYDTGVVAFKSEHVRRVVVWGYLEEDYYRSLLEDFHRTGFERWVRRSYRRREALPSWVFEEGGRWNPTVGLAIPDEASEPGVPAVLRVLEAWNTRPTRDFLEMAGSLEDVPAATRSYLDGLIALGRNEVADAGSHFDRLLEVRPDFAPGRLYRGIARTRLRDLKAAREDLEACRESMRGHPRLYLALADLALAEGDLDRACFDVLEARAADARDDAVDRRASRLLHLRRAGAAMTWFGSTARNAVVGGQERMPAWVGRKVAEELDEAYGTFAFRFPGLRPSPFPLRVNLYWRTNEFESHLAGLGGGRGLHGVAHDRAVGDLTLLWPDGDRSKFSAVLRYEAFHAFLHGSREGFPTWFEEGFALHFADGGKPGEEIHPRVLRPKYVEMLKEGGEGLLRPLSELMVMDGHHFRDGAARNYAQAWGLAKFLAGRGGHPYAGTLDDYAKSLSGGLSARQAFEKHWAPVVEKLEADLRAYVSLL